MPAEPAPRLTREQMIAKLEGIRRLSLSMDDCDALFAVISALAAEDEPPPAPSGTCGECEYLKEENRKLKKEIEQLRDQAFIDNFEEDMGR